MEVLPSKWTKDQKAFVGMTFPTPKEGVITVKSVSTKKRNRIANFICECSLCSEDSELFPYGSIISSKGALVKGGIPCGCSKSNRWTKEQFKVRIERECSKRGYTFKGFIGKYKGSTAKLWLENPHNNSSWKNTSINSFLNCGYGDPIEAKNKLKSIFTKEDSAHIKDFMSTGMFIEGTIFTRNYDKTDILERPVYWDVICPVCSNDEYVQNGLCAGVFTSSKNHLKSGKRPCRCSNIYKWTQEQREYQINKICSNESFKFIGWYSDSEYTGSHSKFSWKCSQDHDCITSAANFVNRSNRCPICCKDNKKLSGNFYGLYAERLLEKDYLYILNFNNEYIKVGRSFEVDRRIKDLSRLSKITNITKLKIFSGNHQQVYDTEQWLHEELTKRGYYHNESNWTTETFDIDCVNILNMLLRSCELTVVKEDIDHVNTNTLD